MRKIKKGDEVIVIAGKFKGTKGKVTAVHTHANESRKPFLSQADVMRVEVEGVTQFKAVKPNPNAGIQGGIHTIPKPIHISNVALVHSTTGKAERIGFKMNEAGKKVRYFKSDGALVPVENQ